MNNRLDWNNYGNRKESASNYLTCLSSQFVLIKIKFPGICVLKVWPIKFVCSVNGKESAHAQTVYIIRCSLDIPVNLLVIVSHALNIKGTLDLLARAVTRTIQCCHPVALLSC